MPIEEYLQDRDYPRSEDAMTATSRSMMDGPPAEIKSAVKKASTKDNWRNWLFVAEDWGVVGAAITLHQIWPTPMVYGLTLVAIGSRMRALANLLHEAAHHKLFKNRYVNNLAGALVCAAPIFVNYPKYVATHRLHHKYLWRDERDPDLSLYRSTHTEFSSASRELFLRFYVKHALLTAIPVMPFLRLYRERLSTAHQRLVGGLVLGGAGGVAIALPPALVESLLLYWIVPWMTTYQILSYWAELGEHGGLRALGWRWGSRNWTGSPISRWLIGPHSDDLYHLLHHWFPSVPHYRLRGLDRECRLLWPEYGAQSYCRGFFWSRRAGRLSVLYDIWRGEPPENLRSHNGASASKYAALG
ncbi:fatty acid desaturase family protein [Nonomuraea sp. NPDC051941]|uniref:fatty acid desaturase family protein n=1 Tax=Nonomuraea sp. NPDC051941 TaxID=3364373 RepID=UPI0037CCB87E